MWTWCCWDVLMPGFDGIETCRRIREDLGLIHLPVVIVTALGDRDARVHGKSVGADDFLQKPVDEAELLARVRALLRSKHATDERDQREQWLESELDLLRSRLLRAERLATLGTLAAGVGHELNNTATLMAVSIKMLQAGASQRR